MNTYGVIYEPNGFIISILKDPSASTFPIDTCDTLTNEYNCQVFTTDEELTPDSHYVDAETVRQVQDFPAITQAVVNENGEYTITLTNIPEETLVTWSDNFVSEENDGFLECVVAFPDEYRFLLKHVRYFPYEVVVNV